MTALVVGLALIVGVLGVLVAGLLRSHAEILKALHELGAGLESDGTGPALIASPIPVRTAGSAAPETITGVTLAGDAAAYSLQQGSTLLAFLSSGCTTCQAFWSSPPKTPAGARLLVVVRDLSEESETALREQAAGPVLVSSPTWDALQVPGSPYFVLVRDGRVVGEGTGTSWSQVVGLLEQAHEDERLRQLRGSGAVREARDEAALRAAGIDAGHPSLYEAS